MKQKIFGGSPLLALLLLAGHCFFAPSLWATPSRASERDYLKALLFEYQHDPELAIKEYGLALSNDKSSAFLAESGSAAALEGGDLKQAKAWAEQAISLSSNSAEGYQLLARVLWAEGDLTGAKSAFEKSLTIDPISVETVYALANLVSLSSVDKAKSILKRFINADPEDASGAYFELASLDLKERHLNRAIAHLKESITIDSDSDSVPSRYALAQVYEMQYSTQAALSQYNKILTFEPRNIKLIDRIAEIHSLDGRWAAARDFFKRALSLDVHDPESNYWLSAHAEEKKDFPSAVRYLKASAALSSDLYLNLQLSYDYTREGDTKTATAVLKNARKIWPKDGTIIFSLALGLEDMKDDKGAATVLRAGLEMNPKAKDMLYELGVILERMGDMAGAEKAFNSILAQNPDDAVALNYLGYSLADRGVKLQEAESLIKKAASLDPQNGAYIDSLGWVYYREGHLHKALSKSFSALAKLPQDGDVWKHISKIESALKKPEQAWIALKMSILFSFDSSVARKELNKMQKKMSKKTLGRYFLDYFSLLQGDLSSLSSSCSFSVKVMNWTSSFPALCSFKAPSDFSVEIMGPMFTPLFSMEISSGVFSMGVIKIRGLSPDDVRRISGEALSLMSDYLSSRPFFDNSAAYVQRFDARDIRSGNWTIRVNKTGLQASSFQSHDYPGITLSVMDFRDTGGHLLPGLFEVKGKGFVLDLTLSTEQSKFKEVFPSQFKP